MKNQYFCDINDYVKYGLLRAIAGSGLRLFVAWMLTPNDTTGHGQKREYLGAPDVLRGRDSELFDGLAQLAADDARTVESVEAMGLIPGAGFFAEVLGDAERDRAAWFARLWGRTAGHACIFFDPDNGFGVRSVPKGAPRSSKYLYWDEFAEAWQRGHSVLVYQHYPRVANRAVFRNAIRARMQEHAQGCRVAMVLSRSVVLALAMQPVHESQLCSGLSRFGARWRPMAAVETETGTAREVASSSEASSPTGVDEILACLNATRTRATYGAVGAMIGVFARSVSAGLGTRRPEASWVVSAESGLPTGYELSQLHPALRENPRVIANGEDLKRHVSEWRSRRFSGT